MRYPSYAENCAKNWKQPALMSVRNVRSCAWQYRALERILQGLSAQGEQHDDTVVSIAHQARA